MNVEETTTTGGLNVQTHTGSLVRSGLRGSGEQWRPSFLGGPRPSSQNR